MLSFASLRDCSLGLASLALAGVLSATLPGTLAADPAPSESASAAPAPAPPPTVLPSGAEADAITPEHPPRVASYTLTARLDAEKHEVAGSGTLVFENVSSAPLDRLYFHLYLNAFKNEKSLFLRSPFGEGRGGGRALAWGYIDVKRMLAREFGGVDLWAGRTGERALDSGDETDVSVPLPRALAPGETLTLELEWLAKLPAIVLRTGYAGDFHFVGQWFPKLARLEPDGRFAHFPFHPQAEFYADYGDYDVTLDVPSRAVVGATGQRVESTTSGERRRERYRASAVHDFAWTAWPGFLERATRIDGVAVRLLYPPGQTENAEATLATLAEALPAASKRYGRYPYPTLTVVHPPERAAEAGGMEYPTLITTGGPWYAGLFGDRALESVAIHELLHQWFYGLVATDERRSPFLDEGLTSYAELVALEAQFGPGSALRGFGIELSATALARALSAARGEDVPLASAAESFPGFRTLAALVYSRTATLLTTLARVYGEDKLARALGVYAVRHRFGHPGPADFVRAIREEVGPEAATALELALHERARIDYLVRDLENARERTAGGIFDGEQGRRETRLTTSPPEPVYRGRAVVYRRGNLVLPVDIELVGADGSRRRERWDGRGSFHVVEWRGRSPLSFVMVDPERRILIDDDLMNNAAAVAPALPRYTLERTSYAASLLLAAFGP